MSKPSDSIFIGKAPGAGNTEGFELVSFGLFEDTRHDATLRRADISMSHFFEWMGKRFLQKNSEGVTSWPNKRTMTHANLPAH